MFVYCTYILLIKEVTEMDSIIMGDPIHFLCSFSKGLLLREEITYPIIQECDFDILNDTGYICWTRCVALLA